MQVCKTVTRGVTPKYEDGSGRFIINQRVNRGVHLDWSALKELSSTLEVPTDCYAKRWDVLVNCLGEGTLGRTHLFMYRSDIYAVDQHMSICRGSTHGAGAYLYQVLSSPSGQEKIESSKTGSTGMTMFNISKLRNFDFLWPGGDLVNEYFQVVEPAWLRVVSNEEESRTLSTLRDTLLPRLISGELRIEAAEQILNRVT
jgi:type I restriction enzyme S subunit